MKFNCPVPSVGDSNNKFTVSLILPIFVTDFLLDLMNLCNVINNFILISFINMVGMDQNQKCNTVYGLGPVQERGFSYGENSGVVSDRKSNQV